MPRQQRKDAKRSDPGDKNRFNVNLVNQENGKGENAQGGRNSTVNSFAQQSINVAPEQSQGEESYVEEGEDDQEEPLGEDENLDGSLGVDIIEDNKDNAASHNLKKYSTTSANSEQAVSSNNQNGGQQQSNGGNRQKASTQQQKQQYDKTLLIPQERYKSSLPKIIITASASVSDASGKKLNYSLGNVLGQGGKELKIPPPTYDDYKEEDVVLDPFFQDVPKILKNDRH